MIEQTLSGAKIVFVILGFAILFWVSVINLENPKKWERRVSKIILLVFLIFMFLFLSYGLGGVIVK